jgi:hypothetical protein
VSGSGQPLGQQFDLRGFARAIWAFEGDEHQSADDSQQ